MSSYLDEPPGRAVWRASVPLMLGSSAGVALTFVDALYVAHYSRAAFTALVLTVPLASLVGAVGTGLAAAAGDAHGRARTDAERRSAVAAAVVLGTILGLVFVAAGWLATDRVAALVGLDGRPGWAEERALLVRYWRWSLPWMAAQLLLGACVQLLSGMGRTREGNRAVVAVVLTGIVVDPLLIYGAGLGIVGAAITMDLSFLLGLALALRAVAPGRSGLGRAALAGAAGRQAAVAVMVFGAIGMAVVVDLLLVRLAAGRGPEAVAVLGVAGQVSSIVAIPTRGVCGGFIAVFAANVAARRGHRYFPLYGWGTLIVAPFYLTGVVLLLAAPGLVLAMFGAPPALLGLARPFLALTAASLLLQIPLRIEQVGFLGLRRPWSIAVQGALAAVVTITVAVQMLPRIGTPAVALGPVAGNFAAGAVMITFFFILLHRRRTEDLHGRAAPAPAPATVTTPG